MCESVGVLLVGRRYIKFFTVCGDFFFHPFSSDNLSNANLGQWNVCWEEKSLHSKLKALVQLFFLFIFFFYVSFADGDLNLKVFSLVWVGWELFNFRQTLVHSHGNGKFVGVHSVINRDITCVSTIGMQLWPPMLRLLLEKFNTCIDFPLLCHLHQTEAITT